MSKIQAELMEALSIKEKKGEARPALLKRIFAAANALEDKPFADLSSKAQDWANKAALANDADPPKPLPDFPDYKAPKADAKDEEEAPAEKPVKAAKGKPAKEEKAAKPAKAEKKEAAPKAKKGPGKLDRIRVLIVKKPKLSGDALVEAVTAAGIEVAPATIAAVRSDLMACIRVLQRAGKLNEDMVELD